MVISVIQGRPVYRYNDSFYDFNLVDYNKYLEQCDHLIYLATAEDISEEKAKSLFKVDSDKVTFIIISKDTLLDYFILQNRKRKAIIDAVKQGDLIVVKMPSITIGKWAANYLRKIGKPHFIEVIGCAWDSFWYHSFKGKLLAPFNFYFTRNVISKAEHVIYVTNEFLQRRYPNKAHNIGCSNVVLPQEDKTVLQKRINKIENRDETKPLKIGTAGAIYVRSKGQEYVIKAMALLKSQGVVVDYYLAGGGSKDYLEKIAVENNVLDNVHFLGVVPKSEMYDFYDMLDIYIHPSLAEGLPRVLIEAESRALPALGANAAGTPELLTDDCIFPIRDITAISNLISSYTKDKMKKQAKMNYNRAQEYALERLNERRRVFYKEVYLNNNK